MSNPINLNKIPSHMLEDIPSNIIPELLESRDGYSTLLDHLKAIKIWVDTVYNAIPADYIGKAGGEVTGAVNLNGGATIDKSLTVNGTATFNGTTKLNSGVSAIGNVVTEGNFGVSAVVSNINEIPIELTYDSQNMMEYIPQESGNYLVYIYIRVECQVTTLNLELNYTDAGGLQNQIILNDYVQSKGSFSIPPIFIHAISSNPIILGAFTNVPRQVYISASIIGL